MSHPNLISMLELGVDVGYQLIDIPSMQTLAQLYMVLCFYSSLMLQMLKVRLHQMV